MQLVAAELDPTLDPFAVAQSFVMRRALKQALGNLDPRKVFYDVRKTQRRLNRILEALEGVTGARPGANLQVHIKGEALESSVLQLADRLALGVGVGGSLIAAAMVANSTRVPKWVPASMGGLGPGLS